ncbi:MAG: hypothetical protein ACLPX9_08765 [Rhodomicrobium sp.]
MTRTIPALHTVKHGILTVANVQRLRPCFRPFEVCLLARSAKSRICKNSFGYEVVSGYGAPELVFLD